ncbi:ankyrin repeat domain-containing protein SOWAHD isoform X1 [Tachysurus ichikawai]
MGDVSEASLLEYIYSSGGKVTNSDLMKSFKQFVSHSDLHLRAKYREDFKLIIDKIAVCKTENVIVVEKPFGGELTGVWCGVVWCKVL